MKVEIFERTLGKICDEVGGTIKTGPFGSQLHQSDYRDVGTPVVMPKDIIGDKLSENSIARISEEDVDRLSQHKLNEGDIVYGRRGDIGRQALITRREKGWLCGTGCLRIGLGGSVIEPLFLHYYLRQSEVIGWIYNQAIGATMPNLNTQILRSVPIKYPPLENQRKIASILSTYDDLIENNTRRIKILEEMAQTIYREWFVNFRFPGHEKAKMVDSPLGKIPEEWETVTLGDLCHIVMGQSPKSEFYNDDGEGLPFHQGVSDYGDRFLVDRIFCTVKSRIAEVGDILFSVRAPVGRLNLSTQKIVIGRGLCAICSKRGEQAFIFQQLVDQFREVDLMGGGTIFKSVTKKDVYGIRIISPQTQVVENFESLAKPMFKELEVLTAKNQNLRQTRDLLLPKLISGAIDVSDLEIKTKETVA